MYLKIIRFLLFRIRFYVLTTLNIFIPKNKSYIYVFDKKNKKDNVWALTKYISDNDLYEEYTVYYYTEVENKDFNNIVFINNPFLALWKQMRSKYIFYSYRGDGFITFRSARKQKIIDTMHGSPLKNIGYLSSSSQFNKMWRYEETFDYILCISDFFKDIIKQSFGAEEEQCIVLGYPRNDVLLKTDNGLKKLGINKNDFSKVIMWMPTWRSSTKNNGDIPTVSFPILTLENANDLTKLLAEKDILLIIKPHPFQMELDIFKIASDNIKIIKNADLDENNVEMYQLLQEVDALLTDYSSVYFDFLLTMKPIGFTIDDFDSYAGRRGFVVDNPLEIMPGEKITNIEELISFIIDIKEGNDKFYEDRQRVNDIANKYKDGNSSKRILEHLGL